MKCQRCNGEILFLVDEHAMTAEFSCPCRVVMLTALGVMNDGQWKPADDSVAGLDGDSGGGGEAAERDHSAETSERVDESSARDENQIAEPGTSENPYVMPGGE